MSWLFFLLFFPISLAANPARKVIVHKDEVVTIKTALGIATILQVPDQPTSVVLGDSSAFKIEYLNQAITIKPLHGHAVSNLYINTDFERYSVRLVTGAQAGADYVVYLKPYSAPRPVSIASDKRLIWKKIGIRRKSDFGSFTLTRMAKAENSIVVEIEMIPTSDGKIDPGVFWLLQGKSNTPIQDLFLSSLDAKKGKPLAATIVVKKSDLKSGAPVGLEIRLPHPISFSLREELLWQ